MQFLLLNKLLFLLAFSLYFCLSGILFGQKKVSRCFTKKNTKIVNSKGSSRESKGSSKESKNFAKDIVLVTKKEKDFEYLSGILFSGKNLLPNWVSEDTEQRYILGVESGQLLSGLYIVIILNDSLRDLMGNNTVTVNYIRYGSLHPLTVTFPMVKKNIIDDKQIFLRLDEPKEMWKKIVAWEVVITDNTTGKSRSQANFTWKKLSPNKALIVD